MNIVLDASTLSLARDGLLALRDAQGTRVTCLDGSLWITEDHGIADVLIGPGESFTIKRSGLTLVMALEPAALSLNERREPLLSRVRAYFAELWSPPAAPA